MKTKKTSMAAILVAIALVVSATTAFATTGTPAAAKSAGENTDPPAGSQQYNPAKTTIEAQHITSYVDRYDGKTYYSLDNGMTWQEGDVFDATGCDYDEIDWWTVEEYEAWLEEQREEYQSMIGERSWNPTEGWYTWDQARVDAAIAGNEQLLEEMKNGKKVSKPMSDGNEMIQFSYSPDSIGVAQETVETVDLSEEIAEAEKALQPYVPLGLAYEIDPATGEIHMTYQGKPVHSLYDARTGTWIANNLYGTDLGPDAIDLEAVYEGGKLTGFAVS